MQPCNPTSMHPHRSPVLFSPQVVTNIADAYRDLRFDPQVRAWGYMSHAHARVSAASA